VGAVVATSLTPGARVGFAVAEDDGLPATDGAHNDSLFTDAGGTVVRRHVLDHDVFNANLLAGVAVDVGGAGQDAPVVVGGFIVLVLNLLAVVGVIDIDGGVCAARRVRDARINVEVSWFVEAKRRHLGIE
jgi:hypothetical protein